MTKSDTAFIDRLIERLDRLDPNSVQGYILKLVREKGLLETVFETIREGVVIIGRDLKINFVNQSAINMLGLPANVLDTDEKINRYLKDLEWERLMSHDPEEWERVSRQQIEVFYPQYRCLLFYLLPLKYSEDTDNEGVAVIILHDVTELRQRTEHEIEEERFGAISMLAAGVAHEIGNPLNSITIHLQLLERYFRNKQEIDDETSEAREMVEVALEEVRRLDQIIHSFLSAVRRKPIEAEMVALEKLVSETLKSLNVESQKRGIQVNVDWGMNLPKIKIDPGQIKQALYNIILNSIQAMGEGGELDVLTDSDGECVFVRITDTGKGISARDLDSIFEPYYTTKNEGTGLGLVIVDRIIRDHGAELHVDSQPGKGTRFTIRFPLRNKRTRMLEAPELEIPLTPVEVKEEDE